MFEVSQDSAIVLTSKLEDYEKGHQCQMQYNKYGSLNPTLTHLLQSLCLQIVYCQLLNLCQRTLLLHLCLHQTKRKKKRTIKSWQSDTLYYSAEHQHVLWLFTPSLPDRNLSISVCAVHCFRYESFKFWLSFCKLFCLFLLACQKQKLQ